MPTCLGARNPKHIGVDGDLSATVVEEVIAALVSGRVIRLLNSRTCIEQRADDRNIVSRTIAVDHAPRRLTERRPAVHVLGFQWRAPLEKQLDGVQLSANHRPVQASLVVLLTSAQVNTAVQQELDDLISAVLTRPPKARLHLRFGGFGQGAVVVEKRLDHIESSDTCGALEI